MVASHHVGTGNPLQEKYILLTTEPSFQDTQRRCVCVVVVVAAVVVVVVVKRP